MTLPNWALEIKVRFKSRVKGNELFIKNCPYCGNTKWNLQVSLTKCKFNCWSCPEGGPIKKFLLQHSIDFNPGDIRPVREITKQESIIKIPDHQDLIYNKSKYAELARGYLYKRGLTTEHMDDWDIKLATGEDKHYFKYNYFGHLIVPFYGLQGIEYYIAIRFLEKEGYKLPEATKDRFTAKRRGADSIVISEGFFDGVSVYKYTDYDILILMGIQLLRKQLEYLKRINYKRIYICLDGEAKKEALELAMRLYKEGLPVYLTLLPEDKDPDDVQAEIKKYLDDSIEVGLTTKSKLRRLWIKQ